MSEYYIENFESYSRIFKKHAVAMAQLMRSLDTAIIEAGLPPVGRTEKLFSLVQDLNYLVERTYKEENNIKDEYFRSTYYMDKDAVISAVQDVFKRELAHYLGTDNGSI